MNHRLFVLSVAAVLCLAGFDGRGATRTWVGAGGNDNAGTPENWSGGLAPVAEDVIVLTNLHEGNPRTNVTWNLTISVASWTQASAYSGTVTFLTKYPAGAFTNFVILGDAVLNGGTWTHLANGGVTLEQDRLAVTVRGDFTLGPGATINVTGKGFAAAKGPAPSSLRTGAGHGGHGAPGSNWAPPGAPYGSLYSPTNLGSGGYAAGGGAVLLEVGGTATVDGTILAKGQAGSDVGGSAGGSIFIQPGWLTGTGELNAAGGEAITSGGAGGGGRIAVALREGTQFGNVRFKAFGVTSGRMPSAAGTVYLQKAGQAAGEGVLIVDNDNVTAFNQWIVCTLIPDAGPRNGNHDLSRLEAVVVTNRGILGLNTNTRFDFGTVPIRGAGASVVTNWRTASAAPAGGVVAVRGTNAMTFPADFVISNYSLCLDQPVCVTGNWVVASNGSLSHSGNFNPLPGQEEFRLRLKLFGNLTVEPGGAIEANAKGYMKLFGPAPGVSGKTYPKAAGHAGRGSTVSTGGPLPDNAYGSATAPTTLGSGGAAHDGGGSIDLEVHGTTTVNEVISARPPLPGAYQSSGAAGGSIFLRTGWLAGSGSLEAQGGAGTGGGGGGRVSAILTQADSFAGIAMRAAGAAGGNGAGPGTVYRERASEAGGRGVLTFDNAGVTTVSTNSTAQLPAPGYDLNGELKHVTLVISNRAQVVLTAPVATGDLFLQTNSLLHLKGHVLRLAVPFHEDWGLVSRVLYEGGSIEWYIPKGTLILIR
jgi:hypothetical protein